MAGLIDWRPQTPDLGYPDSGDIEYLEGNQPRLRITVFFTTIAGTLAAMRTAVCLGKNLNPEIRLIVPQVVPFRYPLEHPPVSQEYFERLSFAVVLESGIDPDLATIEVHRCRDRMQCLPPTLEISHIVVIGGKKRWGWTEGQRMAAALRAMGHCAILVHADSKNQKTDCDAVIRHLVPQFDSGWKK
ncbi:MAG TPA: hypothetical protein VG892_09165 [Terriglobales bacterium]|jgi:hypothetical protein|nr:hypothetical protein [Terriglobales bacterium]